MKYNKMKKGIQDIQKINLSDGEKNDIFGRLDLHMKNNPITHTSRKVTMPETLHNFFAQYRYSYGVIVAILILFITASTSYAAEWALPGDILYPIKINVNEKIKSVVLLTPKSKAKYEEIKVIKRLSEAEELIKKGKFDDNKRIQIENEVEKSVETINSIGIERVKNKNASSSDEFRKDLDMRFNNIKKVNVELNIDTQKKYNKYINKDQVEKFEKKIKVQIGGFLDGDNKDDNKNKNDIKKNDNKDNDNKDSDKKENNRGKDLLR